MNFKLLSFLSIFSLGLLFGNYIDVITLQDGSIVKGIIIEQKPDDYIKIEIEKGSVIKVFLVDVKLISKEKTKDTPRYEEREERVERRERRSASDEDSAPSKDEFLDAGFDIGDYNRARSMDLDIGNYKLWKESRNNVKSRRALKAVGIPLFAVGLAGAAWGLIQYGWYKLLYDPLGTQTDSFYFKSYFDRVNVNNAYYKEMMYGITILLVGGGVFLVGTILWIISGTIDIPQIFNRKGRRVSIDLLPYMNGDTQGLQIAYRF